ncbi:hypothetical protein Poli38472_006492 [Pythium oligandrum]|uniref:Uncharacterized protein n=1 Tax=Pythium oligandrum TaxID=41045 RepID=A0A8K1C4R1_PYTOL|nr:hypothetical protein Poli38472_006492 [Pythium oligandrum]|eukprot:TMW56482.1 hypothetical protein Poli38472_006492 [Pythium oligandrum]
MEWLHAVNFDERGAFLASYAHEGIADAHQPSAHDLDAQLSIDAREGHPHSGSSGSELSSLPDPNSVSPSTPSFESWLGVPRSLLVHYASELSRTEAALLFEITNVAVAMDVIVESVFEQLQDRQSIERSLRLGRALQSREAFQTTLVAMHRQAEMTNSDNISMLLHRLDNCLNTLRDTKYHLAQCIEHHAMQAEFLEESQLQNESNAKTRTEARREIARVEEQLLDRLYNLEDTATPFAMSPLRVPNNRQSNDRGPQVCWPASSATTSPTPEQHLHFDMSASYSHQLSTIASASSSSVASSVTETSSLRVSLGSQACTPRATEDAGGVQTSASGSSGNGSGNSEHDHSQPVL